MTCVQCEDSPHSCTTLKTSNTYHIIILSIFVEKSAITSLFEKLANTGIATLEGFAWKRQWRHWQEKEVQVLQHSRFFSTGKWTRQQSYLLILGIFDRIFLKDFISLRLKIVHEGLQGTLQVIFVALGKLTHCVWGWLCLEQ